MYRKWLEQELADVQGDVGSDGTGDYSWVWTANRPGDDEMRKETSKVTEVSLRIQGFPVGGRFIDFSHIRSMVRETFFVKDWYGREKRVWNDFSKDPNQPSSVMQSNNSNRSKPPILETRWVRHYPQSSAGSDVSERFH